MTVLLRELLAGLAICAAGVASWLPVASCPATAIVQEQSDLAAKKIIGFAADRVNAAYLRDHVAQIEQLPIDGLMITVLPDDWMGRTDKRNGLWFGGARYARQDYTRAIADLKATKFTRFTDNFMDFPTTVNTDSFIAGSGKLMAAPPSYRFANVDWFDKDWAQVAQNGAVAAYVAREGGLKGLVIDVEGYGGGGGLWKFPFLYESYRQECASAGITPRTARECVAKIRQRGREFMAAIGRVFPDITIIFIQNTGWAGDKLVKPFVMGMLERRGTATFVDGGEGGYPLVTHREFANLREAAESVHRADEVFQPMQYGFGVWVDRTPNKYGGWHTKPADFHRNYRTPLELENTLHGALAAADRYVWLYIWHPQLWYNPHTRLKGNLALQARQCQLCPHAGIPQEYLDAIRNCHKPHDLNWTPKLRADRFVYFDDAVLVEGSEVSAQSRNILQNSNLEQWSSGQPPSPVGWIVMGQGPVTVRETKILKSGGSCARLTTELLQGHVFIDQHIPAAELAGKTVTFGAWIKTSLKNVAGVQILDRANDMWAVSGGGHPGDGKWHFVTVARTIRPDATGKVRLRLSAHIPYLKAGE